MADIYSQDIIDLDERQTKGFFCSSNSFHIMVKFPRFSLREHGFHALVTYSDSDVRSHHHALFVNGKKL